jgi:hypothetical protein
MRLEEQEAASVSHGAEREGEEGLVCDIRENNEPQEENLKSKKKDYTAEERMRRAQRKKMQALQRRREREEQRRRQREERYHRERRELFGHIDLLAYKIIKNTANPNKVHIHFPFIIVTKKTALVIRDVALSSPEVCKFCFRFSSALSLTPIILLLVCFLIRSRKGRTV